MYPICFVVGYGIGQAFLTHRQNYWAERDAVFRHYIQLHPEDFVPPGIYSKKLFVTGPVHHSENKLDSQTIRYTM